jgi:monovalent cation/hydrogen antiporter
MLSIGHVLVSLVAVTLAAHAGKPRMRWAAAFMLGAVVSPPDAVAATSVAECLRLPRQIVSIIEGGSRVDDATALVAYRMFMVSVVTRSFSL